MVCKNTREDGSCMANVGITGLNIVQDTFLKYTCQFVNYTCLVEIGFRHKYTIQLKY